VSKMDGTEVEGGKIGVRAVGIKESIVDTL
jgi:hypothetical protein